MLPALSVPTPPRPGASRPPAFTVRGPTVELPASVAPDPDTVTRADAASDDSTESVADSATFTGAVSPAMSPVNRRVPLPATLKPVMPAVVAKVAAPEKVVRLLTSSTMSPAPTPE